MPRRYSYDMDRARQAAQILEGNIEDWAVRRRAVLTILGSELGLTLEAIAVRAQVNRKTVRHLTGLLEQGLEAVTTYNRGGKAVPLSGDLEARLRNEIQVRHLSDGLNIQMWLRDNGVRLSIKGVYSLLHRLGVRLSLRQSPQTLTSPAAPTRSARTVDRLRLTEAEVITLRDRLASEANVAKRAQLAAVLRVGTTSEKMSSIAADTELTDLSSLTENDIVDCYGLLERILARRDSLAIHLHKRLFSSGGAATEAGYRRLLLARREGDSVLRSGLFQTLKSVLDDGSILTAIASSPMTLRPETQALLERKPQGSDQKRLRRMLLTDCFPRHFPKQHICRQTLSRWCRQHREERNHGPVR